MENKYLEKVAILNMIGGYQGAKKTIRSVGLLPVQQQVQSGRIPWGV